MLEITYIINKLNKLVHLLVFYAYIFLLGILIFKGLTARRFYKSFGVKGLNNLSSNMYVIDNICPKMFH
jgi:hypothetical protein